jgi:iron complex outermembrane receptor protein/vitamin B12 transporter
MRCRLAFFPLLLCGLIPAHAVVVRGRVTNALGQPLPGARVQLIQLSGGPRNAADNVTGPDGSFELLSGSGGRFLLLTSPSANTLRYAPQIGAAFYGGRSDVIMMDVALNAGEITPQVSDLAGFPVPLEQLPEQPKQVAADALLTQAEVVPELRPLTGVRVVELGQIGTPATLFLRGAPVTKVLVDGVVAEQLGGAYNFSTLSTGGLSAVSSRPAIEVAGGADPLYGVDASAGVLLLSTGLAATMHPVLTITADAGNLSTERNDAAFSVVHSRSDALVEFARFDTDNDLPAARMHQVTEAANLGYFISGNTSLRLTLRNDVDAAPMPSPYELYRVAPQSKLASQNLYGGFAVDTRTASGWHNAVRYGLVRERAEALEFSTPASGIPVTITGANGYSATGTATFLAVPAREDAVTNRNEYGWQSDYRWKSWLNVVGNARYDSERGADLLAAGSSRVARNHLAFALALSGETRNRLFYEASGFLDRAADLGLHGGPKVGLRYVPVRPGPRKFRGTSLHLTAATGTRELSTIETAQFGTLTSPRSRTAALGVEQNILPKTLTVRATYFHGQYSHETEVLAVAPLRLGNALAYRAQGVESEVRWQPSARLLVAGGYTFLASLVERSAAQGVVNPNLPGVAIGATTALAGQRPFDRAPHAGFVVAQYSGAAFAASLKATFSGRSDGTTGLVLNPTLLLPNHDLSPGYGAVDASFSYNVSHAITVFTQATNLVNDRHIAPIGYLSTPFGVRVGLRVRLGRE